MVDTIEVTVDKSHLVTIGERLYGESVELIRELVNNAYDADATEVKVQIRDDTITVEDNGSGMDLGGFKQYFNIGSPEKRIRRKSPKFGRDRIGEFGIGKFATLSACSRFEVWSKKGDFQGRVIFDKREWEESGEKWHLPLELEKIDLRLHDGTKVTLKGVHKRFNLQEVEKRVIETVPIKAPDFTVYLNSHKITTRFVPGHRIPFLEGTEFGIIHGEIIITSQLDSSMDEAGVECKVKKVTIKRDFFGLEKETSELARIRGEVNADFLPITSDRTDFIKDSPEYQKFLDIMKKVVERVKKALEEMSDYKENRRTKRTVTRVLDMVRKALLLNPDYCPCGLLPIGEEKGTGGSAGLVEGRDKGQIDEETQTQKLSATKKTRNRKPQVKRLTPTAIVKKLKLGRQGVSCCIDHLGKEGPECLTEGTVVYINRDHPLYQKELSSKNAQELYIARLLTQEISLMKSPRSPRHAYRIQSKLLRDGLVE